MQKKNLKTILKKISRKVLTIGLSVCMAAFFISLHVQAQNQGIDQSVIQTGFTSLYQVVASIVSNIGQLFLLWGVFEMAASMNTQDGMAQSSAFKRVGGGLIACIAPQIIPLINIGAGTGGN
ncbi:hypothetical protein BN3660_01044 [Eubacteriaceae bacterium CHKCI004]|nr:hypothetical protein BN3660_01044 [Eubacteriaceae bacterium CHKCI004]